MRIAVATRFAHTVGGVETYLAAALPGLASRGHHVSVWHEFALDLNAERMTPGSIPTHQIGPDAAAALADISAWRPDVVFLNGLSDPNVETELGAIAPLVVLLHAYHGTCISGTKTYSFPATEVCSRALGPGCLVNYLPRRCGGWSPVTMVSSYVEQRRRQTLLRTCAAVATLSEHMRQECIAQGVAPDHVRRLPAFVVPQEGAAARPPTRRSGPLGRPLHLLFMGRMERLKGGHVLLQALDRLDATYRRDLAVNFVGDGRERVRWEQTAARVSRGEFDIQFTGWLGPSERSAAFAAADLLVVPSLWPEPFGLVGPEAASAGVPALAFDVGGIREWLTDSVNGRLVPPAPDAAGTLAHAIRDCLSDPARLQRWGAQALADSQTRTLTSHVDSLEDVLAGAATRRAGSHAAERVHEASATGA